MTKALILVDVQIDFCEGGALAVAGGTAVAKALSEHTATTGYDHVIATRDYHIDPGAHFSDNPDFLRSWPVHCVAGTAGAAFHPELDVSPIGAVFSKGQYSDGYSGFEGTTDAGENLVDWLRAREVDELVLTGIALDHCIRATGLEGRQLGFAVRVLTGLSAGIAPSTVESSMAELEAAGAELVGRTTMSA